ncbi:MAG: Tetracenomycin polyketide synthesis O-methyltransferase tcmP [Bacteroidetes bacterium]|nr:Tetracenomycin polyketide synthesis O-methyltransferase tcmP [Bacteroidota bacterium]
MIKLDKEKETLLIPLYGKAVETQKKRAILHDVKALEIINNIDYDFSKLRIPQKTNTMMSLRARLIDDSCISYLYNSEDTLAIHLGCGLDSRYNRINNSTVHWIDLDYPEVIDIRRQFYPESENYRLMGSSVTDYEWIEKVPQQYKNNIIIAEGLLMYLSESEIKTLFEKLKQRLGSFVIIFDAFNKFTSKKVNNHPSIKKTGAEIKWGLDHSGELEKWNQDYKLIKEIYFTSNSILKRMGGLKFIIYRMLHFIPLARNAQKIFIFQM